jgi:hypothetical protein
MRKIITSALWLLFICLLSRCALQVPQFPTSYPDIGATSPGDIEEWITRELAETTDMEQWGKHEYWAWPEETITAMAGDCDDRALLFGDMCRQVLGISEDRIRFCKIYLLDCYHVMVRIDGSDYMSWSAEGYTLVEDMSWGRAMEIAAICHSK